MDVIDKEGRVLKCRYCAPYVGLRQFAEALSVIRRILERRPAWLMAQVLAVIALAGSGRETEARDAAVTLRANSPSFTVSHWRRAILHQNRADVPDLEAMLVAAGVPA